MTRTIRFRITALATVVVVVVLVAAGVALVAVVRSQLVEAVDEAVAQRADDVDAALRAGGDPEVLAASGDDTLVQVLHADGTVVAASPALAGAPPLADLSETGGQIRTEDVPGVGAARVRSVAVDGPGGPVLVSVSGALDDVDESTAVLATSLAVGIPLVGAAMAALVWFLVGRTLRPVEDLRAQVDDIRGTDLTRRVSEPATEDEVARLARTMNAMLDRVEQASERQQRFVADAAHELRSPLTRMRSEVEVDLAHPGRADPAATERSVLVEVASLQRLVDDLLLLARLDARAGLPAAVAVDLDDVVLAEAARLRSRGRVEVDTSGLSAAQVRGDGDQLARAVRNLVENAERHARRRVTLTLGEQADTAVLAVADDGPGVPATERERVFERFARVDASRTAGIGGTGLGLAIAREIVERHGGAVVIDADHTPGARFVVTLPTATP